MSTCTRLPAIGLSLVACLAASAARAADPNATLRYVSVAVQRDANDEQTLLGTLSLPLAERRWLQVSVGQTRTVQDAVRHRAGVLGAAAGHVGDGWLASFAATHRTDGERLRQTDWLATLEGRGEGFDVGLDGSYRASRRQDMSASAVQRVNGAGLGLHGGLMLGDRARLYGSAIRYDLRRRDDSPSLVQTPLPGPSLLARDELALRRSVQAGVSYRFDQVALSAEYLGDRVLDSTSTLHTVQLKAMLHLAPGWTLAPAMGHTRNAAHGGVNFGALTVTRGW